MRDKSLESMPTVGRVAGAAASPTRALILATISFALSFAAWGLVGGLASIFTGLYALTASQTALLVAVPVLLGSLARLPMGMLTDRFGGRLVFSALLAFSSLAALHCSAHRQLSVAARRGLSHRHGRIVVLGRRGIRLALDPGSSARHSPGHLRLGHDGTVTGRVRRACRGRAIRLGGGVPRHERVASGVGGGVFRARAQSAARRASGQRRRHDRSAAARAHGVAARSVLFPDVRRFRGVFHLPADAAAGAIRTRAGRRRLSRRRLRRGRHAHAARRRLAGGPHRWRPGALMGVRRRRRCSLCC